ncbi:MAG TPA: hypothetical protein VEP93_07610, partial [Variovorax sp.]|nr:hypothetical protein [Variovorax sp.]
MRKEDWNNIDRREKKTIMDFQLKTLTLSRAAAEKADALIVLFADGAIESHEPLAKLAADARKAGDFADKAGKVLSLYKPLVGAPRTVVLASSGDGKAVSVRSAVLAALGAVKSAKPGRVAVVFAQ